VFGLAHVPGHCQRLGERLRPVRFTEQWHQSVEHFHSRSVVCDCQGGLRGLGEDLGGCRQRRRELGEDLGAAVLVGDAAGGVERVLPQPASERLRHDRGDPAEQPCPPVLAVDRLDGAQRVAEQFVGQVLGDRVDHPSPAGVGEPGHRGQCLAEQPDRKPWCQGDEDLAAFDLVHQPERLIQS